MSQDTKSQPIIRDSVSIFSVVICVLLLAGCALLPPSARKEVAPGLYDHVLPAGWEAIGSWHPINLDGDDEEESLLFFRFDNGQAGALILEGDPTTSISSPAYLLPRYFDAQGALGQGMIAAPGTPSSAITLTIVSGDSPARELVVLGGGTHLTFAWWKGTRASDDGNDYGVTQLYAPGGFGVDWETWQAEPGPLQSVIAYYPLEDYRARANLCRIVLYIRRTDLPSDFPAIIFSPQPQGLHFCGSTIPTHPFAPEGVVLAYLRWPRADGMGLIQLLTPGTTLPQLDAESAFERLSMERIEEIAAYPSASVNPDVAGGAVIPATTVCVEFAEIANPALRRWLLFTLRYQPFDAAQRLPGRWTISGAVPEPAPMEPPPPDYCEAILDRNAP